MSKPEVTVNNNSVGVLGLLGIVFVVLKLCGVISWSWWWVTAPFWGGLALMAVIIAVAGILVLVATGLQVVITRANKVREPK